MEPKKHSEAVLSDLRNYWWNEDFLQLMAGRLGLPRYGSVADIGCGHGHWGLRLLRLLSPSARLEGLDQEQAWIDKATANARDLEVGQRCRFRIGSAEELPFEDDSFELVTCQTLLMHVAHPETCIREMHRIVRPGGRVLLAEPSNLPNQFATDTVNRLLSPKQVADLACLFFACARGRARLGRGDDSIGDVLPQALSQCGFEAIQVFQNDKANLILPPYDEVSTALLAEELGHIERAFWLWNENDARILFEAGGGDSEAFKEVYGAFQARTELFEDQVKNGVYARTGGSFHYLVAATRPLAI